MKKIILTLLILAGTLGAFAQNRNLERFSGEEGVSYVYISKAMLNLISGMGGNNSYVNGVNVSGMIDKVDMIQIVSANSSNTVGKLRAEIRLNPPKDMEVLMQVVEEDNRVDFYTLKQGETITDLLMISDSGSEYTILQIQGRFTSEDIRKITESVSKQEDE